MIEIEPAVRADLHRRAGDPAPEDAARRDLRRADAPAPSPDGTRRRSRWARAAERSPTPRTQDVDVDSRGRHARPRQTQDATQIDEIFNALDKQTRTAFQRWQQNAAVAINGRGLDLNDAFGNLGPFARRRLEHPRTSSDRQQDALQGLVRDTGTVFDALSERDRQLAGAITGSDTTFDALASEDQALAETFQILPDVRARDPR